MREAPVTDYFSYVPYLSFAAVAGGIAGLTLLKRKRRQQEWQGEESCAVVSDWRPTGKIDFSQNAADPAGPFCLQTEEYRVLESLSGTRHIEVRWRPALLEEAKRVARYNNTRDAIIGLPLHKPLPTPSLVPSLAPPESFAGGESGAGDDEVVPVAEPTH